MGAEALEGEEVDVPDGERTEWGIEWSTKGPEVYIQGPPRVLAVVWATVGHCGRLAGMGAGVTVECELRVCLGRVFGTRFRLRKEAGSLAATFWLWMAPLARPGTRFRLRKLEKGSRAARFGF